MKLIGTLTAIHSKRDTNGNTYWAMRYLDHETGREVVGTVSGGESNINAIRAHWPGVDGWHSGIVFNAEMLPIREFNRLTKDWEHAGCTPIELVDFVTRGLTS